MRYPTNHKQATRDKLLESSRAVAKKGGFDATGVDALMAAVGLSGGAFYGHFGSKAALFEALVEHEMAHSTRLLAGDAAADGGFDHIARSLRRYLGASHVNAPEAGCALPALGAEIARATPAVRAAVERALKDVQRRWSAHLDDPDTAWALLALCVGAVLLARAVESESTKQEILAASRRFVAKVQPPGGSSPPAGRAAPPASQGAPPAGGDGQPPSAAPRSRATTGSRSRRRRRRECGR